MYNLGWAFGTPPPLEKALENRPIELKCMFNSLGAREGKKKA